jgi:acyl carrier protein
MNDIERLDEAFRSALALAADEDPSGAAFGVTASWDSVGHIQLIAAIEVAFGITLEADEVFDMSDYAAVRRVLEARRAIVADAP